jgi:GDP-L-fucose synthase
MERSSRIFVAGHTGMVGSALLRRLRSGGYDNVIVSTRAQLDLLDGPAVREFMLQAMPDVVLVAAARVGGIVANDTRRAEFLHDNLLIQTHLIDGAHRADVQRLLFLGSSCIYPRDCPQPIREEYLLTGPLEPTNEPYAIAKIAGVKLTESYSRQYGRDYFSVMPTNLYGPNDNYDPMSSHVLPALLRRAHMAKAQDLPEMVVWGTGKPRREFLHVDDLADACVHLMEIGYQGSWINVGSGEDLSIRKLAELVCRVVGFKGRVVFDPSKPDGTPRKLLDVSRMAALGWRATTPLHEGIASAYAAAPFLEEAAA